MLRRRWVTPEPANIRVAYERLRVALGELLAKPASPGMNPAPPLDEAMQL